MYRSFFPRILSVLACSLLVASVMYSPAAAAAGEETKADERANSLYPGSWSLQFQITDEIGLRPFNGMMISVKHHLSRQAALRLGLQMSADWNSSTETDRSERADTLSSSRDILSDDNHQSFTIDLSYVRYPWPGSYVNLFWGIGPLVSFSRREETADWSFDGGEVDRTNRAYRRSWDLGALGLVGAEWFLSKHFSFHCEYRGSITYGRSIEEQEEILYSSVEYRNLSKDTSDGWNFKSMYATLGLSVYF